MATYAIGDIQGCLHSFQELLNLIGFNSGTDRLWLVGDLVNRGPDSLGVLRFVKELGSSCTVVLGNHDLHLLAVHAGITSLQKKDTLHPVLAAPDCENLMAWLRHQSLLYREDDYVLVHAGILPHWSLEQARTLAHEVECALRTDRYQDSLAVLYRSTACKWEVGLSLNHRLGFTTNVLTRMRVCSQEGYIDLSFKGKTEYMAAGYSPWFLVPPLTPRRESIIFGHWSDLGSLITEQHIGIDGGCIWGKKLVAFCLENRKVYSVSCSSS